MVRQIIDCESGGDETQVGDGGLAKGIVQYHEETFYRHCRKARFTNCDWLNSKQQVRGLRYCLTEGNCGKEWSCYKKLFIY